MQQRTWAWCWGAVGWCWRRHVGHVSVAPNGGQAKPNPFLIALHQVQVLRHPLCRPEMDHKPVALVGFREWIFSQDSGGLAGAGWQEAD